MAHYLVTYHGSEMPHDPEAMAAARDAFMQWAANVGAALVDPGAPVSAKTTISNAGVQQGPAEGPLQGWSVIEADSPEAAEQILSEHPFISRGGRLQVNTPVAF
jgi:hypothetical protein